MGNREGTGENVPVRETLTVRCAPGANGKHAILRRKAGQSRTFRDTKTSSRIHYFSIDKRNIQEYLARYPKARIG